MVSTDADYILFMSSSGHCSLDCSYCIIDPIVNHQPSLTIEDIEYLLDTVGGKSALIFSGKGDFFAGYKKGDRLLERLLRRDVDVALDINGIIVHEFPELSDEAVAKIKGINLTMHYTQILRKGAESVWVKNARFIIGRRPWDGFLMNTIMSAHDADKWAEALAFYDKHVFAETGVKISLIRDVLNWTDGDEERLRPLLETFGHVVAETRKVDFACGFGGREWVLCPAGKEYFRIWNDGRVEGCPYFSAVADLGNLKDRTFAPRGDLILCNQPRYCDCNHILKLAKMRYPESAVQPLAPPESSFHAVRQ